MLAASKDTDSTLHLQRISTSEHLASEGNALSGKSEKCIGCRNQSRYDCRDCGAYNDTNACPRVANSFHSTPHYYMAASVGEALFLMSSAGWSIAKCQGGDSNPYGFLHQILSLARLPIPPPRQIAMLTNVALLAASGQIALVSFLRFLRQIEGCLRKSSPDPFSSRSLSAPRDKAA